MDAAVVVEVFDPGGDSGVDLVAGGEGTPGHVQVFQMDGVGISIIGRPRPLPGDDTPNPAHNTYTHKCEEPKNLPLDVPTNEEHPRR